jgi:hypothetical protein
MDMKKTLTVISLLNLFLVNTINAQFLSEKLKGNIPVTICYASDSTEKISIPPPKRFFLKAGDTKKTEINVSYSLFPNEAKIAFEYAISIWETLIESDVPIKVQANWRSQGSNTLGSAAPFDYVTDFKNIPNKNCYYPLALAEKLSGRPLNSNADPDIVCTFNRDIDWYFKTDQNTPGELYDFVTVVLHEIAHGLGFTGFFEVRNGKGLSESEPYTTDGSVAAYDLMIINSQNQYLADKSIFSVPSTELYDALTSGLLYTKSPSAAYVNNGKNPRLYVPTTWDSGSSIYHLNDGTYPPSSGNSLMTHAISKGESVHDPGPLTMGIMDDIGWNNIVINFEKPYDTEQVEPIEFKMIVNSENELDTTSLYIFYSSESPDNLSDSLPLIYDSNTGYFTAALTPGNNVNQFFYYAYLRDIKGRVYKVPTNAPEEYYTVKIGADTEKPVITHSPVPYFISTEKEIPVKAYVEDNLGIDSVYIEYAINNIPQQSFYLLSDSATLYRAKFPININDLNDGDIITYRIVATDLAQIKNIATSPVDGYYSFEVFDPVSIYFNDFNSSTTDFTLTDFDVSQAPNFFNGALNSPHPYLNSNQYNINFNFSTMLIHPIILKDNTTMSYDEVVLVEPGEDPLYTDPNFWDYVIVEGSKDDGITWLPLINGYDSRENTTWLTNYKLDIVSDGNNEISQAVGTSDWYVNRQFSLLESGNFVAGDTILIRFRLLSDQFAIGWGWCIDNLSIQSPLLTSTTRLSPGNVLIYPNPFNDAVTVSINSKKTIDNVNIEIYNFYGQKIYSNQYYNVFGDVSENINLSGQPAGLYLVNIQENGINVLTKKVVKQ